MRVMILGDIHGSTTFVRNYVFPTAKALKIDTIIQLGDFGYWEHTEDGVAFIDLVGELCEQYETPMWFLRGNHDNLGHLLEHYWTTDERGFIQLRKGGLFFIPDGTVWPMGTLTFRAFGGAYSIDKMWRLELEAKRTRDSLSFHERAGRTGMVLDDDPKDHTGTLWFPDEEITAPDFDRYLAEYDGPVDVMLSHDRPRSVNVMRELKDIPECWPNQDRLDRALLTHRPKLWLHGHYHHSYTNSVRSGDDDTWTTVQGLACDWDAAPRFVRPGDAWALLEIDEAPGVPLRVTKGTAPLLVSMIEDAQDPEDDEITGAA